ncbi:uncharacterized protein LOC132612910 [Lycium barbarum]|uniref:uncharacterized protein LOC132612910 n=1 Tax=Lycium barbarum TaxID=112863 RepID=UPI00293E96D8|nr:uncharacterized protein LOC132612910 [Lycium barbarum]
MVMMYGGSNVLSPDSAHGILSVIVNSVLTMKLNGMNIVQYLRTKPNQRKRRKGETLRESSRKDQEVPNLYVARQKNGIEEEDILGSGTKDSYDSDPTDESYSEPNEDSSLDSSEEDNPPIFMNQPRELEISEVDDDCERMTDEPIPERRPEPTTPKHFGTRFHTFTLDDINVSKWTQRI